MKSALMHGVLLAVMLVYGYRTWTRDKSVKPDLGSVVLWNKSEAELASIELKSEKKTVRLERKTDGNDAYWWGNETSVEKKPKPKPPEPKKDEPKKDEPAGSGSAGSGSAAKPAAGSGAAAGSGSAVAAGSGSAAKAGSGSAVAAGSGSAKPAAGSGSGSAVAAGSGKGSGSAGSGSAVAAGSGSAGSDSGSAAKPTPPPVEMVETTKHREFPLGDGGDKLVKAYTDARAIGDLGKPNADQLVDYKLATVEQVDAKLSEVKKELETIKANEAAEKAEEKDADDKKDKKKAKKDDKKPELTKKIKELEDQKKAIDGKPRTTLTVTFKDGTNRVFWLGGSVFGGSDRYVLDTQSGNAYVLSKDMVSGLEVGESSLQLTDPRGFDAAKIEQVEVDWNGRKKLAKRTQTADASDKQVKTWTDADTGKANQPLATFIDNVNNLRPTEYAKDLKVDTQQPIFRIEYRDATGGKLGTLALYKVEKPAILPEGQELDPANPPKGEIEYYVVTERTRVPALVRRDPAKKSEEDLPIVFGDKAAPVAPKPGANPFGNVPIKPHGGSAAPH